MHPHFPSDLSPFCIPERRLVTFPYVAGGKLVRCSVENTALALLWGRAAHTEAEQVGAFVACRGRIEDLVRWLLDQGRGAGGGLSVTAEDVRGMVTLAAGEVA
jgi:hypothetical protein